MLRLTINALFLCLATVVVAQTNNMTSTQWPTSVPLGGLGTGYIEVLSNGQIGELTINNNRHQPFSFPDGNFAAVHVRSAQGVFSKKLIHDESNREGFASIQPINITYPYNQTHFQDQTTPVRIEQKAYTPFFWGNPEHSAEPAVIFEYEVSNQSNQAIDVAIAFSWVNTIGMGGTPDVVFEPSGTTTLQAEKRGNLQGMVMGFTPTSGASSHPLAQNAMGEYAILAKANRGDDISYLEIWQPGQSWATQWQTFRETGRLPKNSVGNISTSVDAENRPASAISIKRRIAPNQRETFSFIIAWYMPHQIMLNGHDEGVFYKNHRKSAFDVAYDVLNNSERLSQDMAADEKMVRNSSLPLWLKQQLLNAPALLAKNGVYLENGFFSLFSEDSAHPGNLGTPEERLAQFRFLLIHYPDLVKSELRQFALTQLSTGEVPSFIGNLYAAVRTGDILGGFRSSPDSSLAFAIMVAAYYQWTGDDTFLQDMRPHIREAILWSLEQDSNQDTLPNGYSLWSNVKPNQTSLFTSNLALAAMRVGLDYIPEIEVQSHLQLIQNDARDNLITQLWNGRFFNPVFGVAGSNSDPQTEPDTWHSIAGTLPGEAIARLNGWNHFLPNHYLLQDLQTRAEINYQRNETDIQNQTANLSSHTNIEHLFAQAFESVLLNRFGYNRSAKALSLGVPADFRAYTDCASWASFHALSGFHYDHQRQALVVGPQFLELKNEQIYKIHHPQFQGSIRAYQSGKTPIQEINIQIESTNTGTSTRVNQIGYYPAGLSNAETLILRVLYNGEFLTGQDFTREQLRVFNSDRPINLRAGDEITLVVSPQNTGKIRFSLDQYSYSNLGAHCDIVPLAKAAPDYSLMIINSLHQLQLINLEFNKSNNDTVSLFINGEKLPDISNTLNSFPLVLQTSPLRQNDSQWLRFLSHACEQAIRRSTQMSNRKQIVDELWKLQELIDNTLSMDHSLRGVRLDVISGSISEPPTRSVNRANPDNLQRNFERVESEITRFQSRITRLTQDPILASEIMGYFTPLTFHLTYDQVSVGGTTSQAIIQIDNPQSITHESRVSIEPPNQWSATTQDTVAFQGSSQSNASKILRYDITLPTQAWATRTPLTAILSGTWQSLPYRKELTFAVGHDLVKEWLIVGPFSNQAGEGFQYQYDPELNIQPDKIYEGIGKDVSWKSHLFQNGYIDLDAIIDPNDNAVAYAYTAVYSPREQQVRFEFGTHGDIKLFHNYKEIYAKRNLRNAKPSAEIHIARLYEGWNHLLVKVSERTGPWGFYFQIADLNGMPIPELEYSLTKAE